MLSDVRGLLGRQEWGFVGFTGFVLCCLMMGGGSRVGFLSDVIIQLLAIPVLLAALWRYLNVPSAYRPRFVLTLALLVAAIPAVQLIPLPPWIWSALPGRDLVVQCLALVDTDLPWAPLSVAPDATWLSLVSLMPPVAVFVGCLLLSYRQRRLLSLVLLMFGAASVFLGLTQVAEGPASQLRFFANTNLSEAVGFFANRNHFAALLNVMILLAAAWASDRAMLAAAVSHRRRFEAATILPTLLCFTLLVVLIAGEVMARSRAGLFLTIIALLGALGLAYTDRRARTAITPAKLLVGLVILATIFLVQMGLYRVLDRFASDPLADARIPFARNTVEAAYSFLPLGSGMGSFIPVYAAFEKPGDLLANTFANRAHNDVLELWLEAGLVGAVVLGLCTIWILRHAVSLWKVPTWGPRSIDLILARAASLAIALTFVHSLLDYPLRTGVSLFERRPCRTSHPPRAPWGW